MFVSPWQTIAHSKAKTDVLKYTIKKLCNLCALSASFYSRVEMYENGMFNLVIRYSFDLIHFYCSLRSLCTCLVISIVWSIV